MKTIAVLLFSTMLIKASLILIQILNNVFISIENGNVVWLKTTLLKVTEQMYHFLQRIPNGSTKWQKATHFIMLQQFF